MSSFIVDDKTINRIVSFCYWENDSILKHEVHAELKKIGVDLEQDFKDDKELENYLKAFCGELLKLNVIAFYNRYEHIESIKKEITEAVKSFVYEDLPIAERNHFQVLKSIECFLYQCAEGEIPEKSTLYKALERIAEHLKSHIINKLPEYERAVWG